MSTRNSRAAGLGSLLADPTPPATDDPEFAAHQARTGGQPEAQPEEKPAKPAKATRKLITWMATDTETYEEIARVRAYDTDGAIAKVTEKTGRTDKFTVTPVDPKTKGPALVPARTGRTSGALAHRGGPAVLPRKRTHRIPRDKLTVQVPVSVLDGLDALTARDDTRKYDEVEEALRKHLADKGIDLDED